MASSDLWGETTAGGLLLDTKEVETSECSRCRLFYDKKEIPAKITTVEYDPNRTAFIGLAVYADGEKRYVGGSKIYWAGDTFLVAEKLKSNLRTDFL